MSLAGFSPETTTLAFELVQPEKLLVISSENTRTKVDVIYDKLRDRLAFSQLEHRYCDPVDPVDIYEIVKKAVRPRRPGEASLKAIIDITGGKKVMSAGAALAASQLDLKMCYIDSDFDTEMRQAIPGTERLCILPNPTALFGDKDMDAALEMFRSGVYSGAKVRFGELSDSMSEPARARFLCDLSALYWACCDLGSGSLPGLVDQVRNRLADPRSEVRPETKRRPAKLDFVETLAAKNGSALLLNFFLLGEHYFGLERYDFAALLSYRTIEKVFPNDCIATEFAEAGVEIYPDRLTHAKGAIADGRVGALFSANFLTDQSLIGGIEVGMRLDNTPALAEALRYFEHAIAEADMEFVRNPRLGKLADTPYADALTPWPLPETVEVVTDDNHWKRLSRQQGVVLYERTEEAGSTTLWSGPDQWKLENVAGWWWLEPEEQKRKGLQASDLFEEWLTARDKTADGVQRGLCPATLIRTKL